MIPTHLYLDNYRGFSDTTLELGDATFLVGENSSGKTSVLSVLSLIGYPQFWLEQDFNVSNSPLGHFKEMVSCVSSDPTYFRFGLVAKTNPPGGEEANNAFLFTFKDRGGLPQLTDFTTRESGLEITFKFRGATLFYKVTPVDNKDTREIQHILQKDWVSEHVADIAGYKRLVDNPGASGRNRVTVPVAHFLNRVFELEKLSRDKTRRASGRNVIWDAAYSRRKVISFAPVRSKPRRTYDEVNRDFSPDGEHTPYKLRDELSQKKSGPILRSILESFGKESGLFQKLKIKKLGKDSSAPFEVDVILDSSPLSISNVGYGVSQAMPIVVELITELSGAFFTIQQPEVHLHPRAQAALGDMFYNAVRTDDLKMVVETHSDYLIDRFRLAMSKEDSKVKAKILFFERVNGRNTVQQMNLAKDGSLPANQPKNYRGFFLEEDLKVLGL